MGAFDAWLNNPYVQQILLNTGIPVYGNPDSKLPTGYVNDPGTDPSANIFTKGWMDTGGTWHPYASDFPATRSIPSVSKFQSFLQGPASQSIAGSPYVPVNAVEDNKKYSPFSTSYGPANNPVNTPPSTIPNLTFGNRYLQGTNYAPGDPNAPAGMGGRFWQTLEQNRAGWTPSPTAQNLMSSYAPSPGISGNTINLPTPQIPGSAQSSQTASVSRTPQSYAAANPLFRQGSQYIGSPAWSAMRGMR